RAGPLRIGRRDVVNGRHAFIEWTWYCQIGKLLSAIRRRFRDPHLVGVRDGDDIPLDHELLQDRKLMTYALHRTWLRLIRAHCRSASLDGLARQEPSARLDECRAIALELRLTGLLQPFERHGHALGRRQHACEALRPERICLSRCATQRLE